MIELDKAGHPKAGMCFLPVDHLVTGDVMLAQKIALETDEKAALAVAKSFLVPRNLSLVAMLSRSAPAIRGEVVSALRNASASL